VSGDVVLVVEDDDYYAPTHVAQTVALFADGVDLVGDDTQRYYHVPTRQWRIFANTGASLCQTGFRRELLPVFAAQIAACRVRGSYGMDAALWRATPAARWRLARLETVVGIKGLPGTRGLGIGHRAHGWSRDPTGVRLRQWIGADAAVYLGGLSDAAGPDAADRGARVSGAGPGGHRHGQRLGVPRPDVGRPRGGVDGAAGVGRR
jgi:hypothetical protein